VAITGGTVGIALVATIIQWGSHGFSESGQDQVIHSDLVPWLAIGGWLLLVALWHIVWHAPMGCARVVVAHHERRARTAEQYTAQARAERDQAQQAATKTQGQLTRAKAGLKAVHASSGLPLLNRLELTLKRGQAFREQVSQGISSLFPDPALLTLARGWHDDVYKMLAAERPDLAKRWLDETDAVIEIPGGKVLGQVNPTHQVIKDQVALLEKFIGELVHETSPRGVLDSALAVSVEQGWRLHRAASELDPEGQRGLLDDLLRRVEAWEDRVSDLLGENGQQAMLKQWTDHLQWPPGPHVITRGQVQRLVADPLELRLRLLGGFRTGLSKAASAAPA
jgi:hypothetical protein